MMGDHGADRLFGGYGYDTYQFRPGDSIPGSRDILLREGHGGAGVAFDNPGADLGDRIDLSSYDADETTAGFQHWVFGTTQDKGHLWAIDSGTKTLIQGNSDDDPGIEFEVAIGDIGVGLCR